MLGAGGLGVAVDRSQAKNILTTVPSVVPGKVPNISNKWSAKQGMDWLKENIPQVHVVQDTAGGSTLIFAKRSNGFKDVGDLPVPDVRKMEAGSGVAKGIGKDISKSPRNRPGVVNESFKLDRSLQNQTNLMYNKGAIGVIPKEIRDKLLGKQFNSFDDFRKEFWKTVANSSFAKEFNNRNISRMLEGNAPIAPKVEHYGKQKSYIIHHKQPIDKGGEVYNLDNLMITSPKMHQNILDPSYHFGKKGQ